jgi:hypothetical protein
VRDAGVPVEPTLEAESVVPALEADVVPVGAAPPVAPAGRAAANAPSWWLRAGSAAAVAGVVAVGAWRMQGQWMPDADKVQLAAAGSPAAAAPDANRAPDGAAAALAPQAATAAAQPASEAAVPSTATTVAQGSSTAGATAGTPLPPVGTPASAAVTVAMLAPPRLETSRDAPAERAAAPAKDQSPIPISPPPTSPTATSPPGAEAPPAAAQAPQGAPPAAGALAKPAAQEATRTARAARPAEAAEARTANVARPGVASDWTPQEIQRAADRARAAQRLLAEEEAGAANGPRLAPTAAQSTNAPQAAGLSSGALAGQLHRAADRGDVPAIKRLLGMPGASVDAPDATGRTPLLQAVLSRRPGAVRALLAAGADPTHADQSGLTPQAAARQGRNPEITQILGAGAR